LRRGEFFAHLLDLVRKYLATGADSPRLLDVGCSFGHLIDLANQSGFCAMGLEVDEELLRYMKKKGLLAFRDWSSVPSPLDAITFVDSFYYILNPKEVLQQVTNRLRAGGVALFRVTNRNWVASLISLLRSDPDLSILGDARFSYSRESLEMVLRDAGLSELACIPDGGQGRRLPWRKEIAYKILYRITAILRGKLILAPGIILLATPGSNAGQVLSQEYMHSETEKKRIANTRS
jgi:SAM-dependent methyltransferase